MEINKKLLKKETLDSTISGNKVTEPHPGVVYVLETDKLYVNNVVIPQGEEKPLEALEA